MNDSPVSTNYVDFKIFQHIQELILVKRSVINFINEIKMQK